MEILEVTLEWLVIYQPYIKIICVATVVIFNFHKNTLLEVAVLIPYFKWCLCSFHLKSSSGGRFVIVESLPYQVVQVSSTMR